MPVRRSARPRRRSPGRLLLSVTAALAAASSVGAPLAGCSAGQVTQTGTQVSSVNGASGRAGAIVVRNAVLANPESGRYPVGGQAPLLLTIVNEGSDADQLTAASSPVAGSATITGDSRIPGGTLVNVAAIVTPSPLASGPLASSPLASNPALPPGTAGTLSVHTFQVVLDRLTTALSPGQTYPVTLVFAKAGSLTLPLPLGAPERAPANAP